MPAHSCQSSLTFRPECTRIHTRLWASHPSQERLCCACQSTLRDLWPAALDEELRSVGIKGVFGPSISYGERDSDVPIIHTNTIFTKKAPDYEGRVRLKARLVALGNQEPLDPEERTASPTIIPALIKIMATVGPARQLEERGTSMPSGPTTMTVFDVATAFLNGDLEDKRTYVRCVDPTGHTVTAPITKPLYGLRVAPLRWHEKFTADVAAFGLRPFKLDPCILYQAPFPTVPILSLAPRGVGAGVGLDRRVGPSGGAACRGSSPMVTLVASTDPSRAVAW